MAIMLKCLIQFNSKLDIHNILSIESKFTKTKQCHFIVKIFLMALVYIVIIILSSILIVRLGARGR